ncbi:MAG: adenylate/guanylate cyclase domain-containing protein [Kiloniellales bacterium]
MERRLAAILAADVVGYSRLMEVDEASTLDALRAQREELIEPKVAEHKGRIVKLMGDGLLAEFPSAVEAVHCAVEIQHTMGRRNADVPEDKRIIYRIGINIGDIVVEDNDIYGDGVNVAARLEGLAAPGGICISANVHDQLGGKTDVAFEDAGEQTVKNITKPVGVWRWVADVIGQAGPGLALPGKPSIAVVPFVNMSGDPEQEFFADGMAEDIITGLSRYRWFFVIARNSSFTYKGRAVDVKQVSRELGVRYVVEGSVRKVGNRVRLTAQLIDAATGHHIWAERYDRDLDDIFALQDEITENIVAAIEPELGAVERKRARRKPPNNLDAWDSYQRGLWHLLGDPTRDAMAEARRLFQRACKLDPEFAAAYADLAWAHTIDITLGLTDDPEASLEKAARAAEKAVALDARDPGARFALGRVHILKHAYERAIAEMEAALALNASFERGYFGLGHALLYSGRPMESIPHFERAIRLSPRSPRSWASPQMLACAYFNLGRYEEAATWSEKAIRQPNAPFMPFAHAAAALGHLGRIDEARAMLAEARKRKADFSADTIRNTVGLYGRYSGADRIIEGLRKAGLPPRRS